MTISLHTSGMLHISHTTKGTKLVRLYYTLNAEEFMYFAPSMYVRVRACTCVCITSYYIKTSCLMIFIHWSTYIFWAKDFWSYRSWSDDTYLVLCCMFNQELLISNFSSETLKSSYRLNEHYIDHLMVSSNKIM
jgi:hypothetical protein